MVVLVPLGAGYQLLMVEKEVAAAVEAAVLRDIKATGLKEAPEAAVAAVVDTECIHQIPMGELVAQAALVWLL